MERIKQLVDQIRTDLLEAGMSASRIAYRKERVEKATDEQRDRAAAWLELFIENEIKEYKAACALVTPMVLQMYKMSGLSYKTYEEEQILKTKKEMFRVWDTRPALLQRKHAKTKHQPAKGGSKGSKKAAKGAGNSDSGKC